MNDVLLLLACLAVMVIPVAIHCRILARAAARRIPAAPDNQPGTDIDLLISCRRIDRQTRKENRP
ncbi:hypothetical protein [Streptomyces sp. NPDC057052]|uniref:hypothetical protein n=1 Tax=Streptomyces sp. NPDC057052 TaxID=3346010 RepID=UPI0036333863